MRLLSCVVFLATVVIAPTLGLPGICTRCSCYPPQQPVTVYCNCNPSFQRLTMSPGDMRDIPSVKKFTISFCGTVEFLKNSFSEAKELVTLSLQQIENATIRMGVFSALKMLVVEDVANFQLDSKAFLGVDELRNVVIRRTYVPEIPKHALYDMTNLYSVELEDVTIDTIKSKAVQLKMDDGNPMTIDNCLINNIEENGLVLLLSREFRLSKSKLMSVARNGINITSQGSVSVMGNYFGANISEDAVHISGLSIAVNNNTIQYLPKNFLSNVRGPLTFTNNTLLQTNIDISDLGTLSNTNSTGNLLPCLCSQKTTMSYLSLAEQMKHFLEQNFCNAPCAVSLLSYPEKCSNSTSVEDDDITGKYLCEQETTSTTTTTIATTRRSGRGLLPITSTSGPITPAPRRSGAIQVSTCTWLASVMMAVSLLR